MPEGHLQVVLGQNIRRERLARGLSQEDFAQVLGYHRTYVGGLERGERNLSLRAIERISDTLGVEPLTLLRSPRR